MHPPRALLPKQRGRPAGEKMKNETAAAVWLIYAATPEVNQFSFHFRGWVATERGEFLNVLRNRINALHSGRVGEGSIFAVASAMHRGPSAVPLPVCIPSHLLQTEA